MFTMKLRFIYFIKIVHYVCFVYSAVFTLLATFYASIDFVKHNCVYSTRAWSSCYDKFTLTFISTDFAQGTFYTCHSSSHGGLLSFILIFLGTLRT
jgi:hypothetical protein